MIPPPPKYTRTAEEGPINQHHNSNSFIDDESNDIDAPVAPPPAYSSRAPSSQDSQDAQHGSEEGSIRNDWPLVPSPSQPHQAHPPATRRGNPFVADIRAWNAFQVVNLSSSNRAPRVGSSRALRTAPRRAPRYRSRGDVETAGQPLRNPNSTRKFRRVLPFMFRLRREES
jgi:hypothetical protein